MGAWGLCSSSWPGREETVAVAWGFSHLRLCPAGLGLGLESWLRRDIKATCFIQGSFFSELWIRQRGSGTRPSLSQGARGQVWGLGTVGLQLEEELQSDWPHSPRAEEG